MAGRIVYLKCEDGSERVRTGYDDTPCVEVPEGFEGIEGTGVPHGNDFFALKFKRGGVSTVEMVDLRGLHSFAPGSLCLFRDVPGHWRLARVQHHVCAACGREQTEKRETFALLADFFLAPSHLKYKAGERLCGDHEGWSRGTVESGNARLFNGSLTTVRSLAEAASNESTEASKEGER